MKKRYIRRYPYVISMFYVCIRMYSNWNVFLGVLVKIFLKMIVLTEKHKRLCATYWNEYEEVVETINWWSSCRNQYLMLENIW